MTTGPEVPRHRGSAVEPGFVWNDHDGHATVATSQQLAQLNRDGYFVLERAFHADTTDEVVLALAIEAGVTELDVAARPDDPPTDVLRRFCSHPLLAGLARDFIGPDARVGADDAVVRYANQHQQEAFHQDVAPTSRPTQFITCWVSLTDATRENGALQIARGWHRRGLLRYDLTGVTSPDPNAGIDPVVVIDIEVPAGSVVVMSSLTPRRVRPNSTDHAALAYAIQYVSDVIDLDDHATNTETRRQFPVVRGGQLVGPS